MESKTKIETLGHNQASFNDDFSKAKTLVSVTINNTKGSFGCFQMNVEPSKIHLKEYVEKIEQLYQERLKDKDEMIAQLQKIIKQISCL